MLELLVVVTLSAAPVHVVAAHGDQGAALALWKDPKVTVHDGSAAHEYLLRPPGLAGAQLFDGFTAPAVAGWPVARASAWSDALGYCQALVGPAPWKGQDSVAAMGCGTRLGQYLWQQYVTGHGAARVLELDVSRDEGKGTATVSGVSWSPTESTKLTVDETVPLAQLQAAIERVVGALKAKKGASAPHELIGELAPKSVGDPWVGAATFEEPLKLAVTCPALPAKLTFKAEGPLAATLAKRWAPTDVTGAALACSLSYSERQTDLMGVKMPLVTSFLTCGKVVVATELVKSPVSKRPPMDVVSTRLAQALSSRLCR